MMNIVKSVYKCKHHCLHVKIIVIYANIIVYIHLCSIVCGFLFTCLPFFMLVFFVILICKQYCLLDCFVFVGFVYNFNVKRYKSKTLASILLATERV